MVARYSFCRYCLFFFVFSSRTRARDLKIERLSSFFEHSTYRANTPGTQLTCRTSVGPKIAVRTYAKRRQIERLKSACSKMSIFRACKYTSSTDRSIYICERYADSILILESVVYVSWSTRDSSNICCQNRNKKCMFRKTRGASPEIFLIVPVTDGRSRITYLYSFF